MQEETYTFFDAGYIPGFPNPFLVPAGCQVIIDRETQTVVRTNPPAFLELWPKEMRYQASQEETETPEVSEKAVEPRSEKGDEQSTPPSQETPVSSQASQETPPVETKQGPQETSTQDEDQLPASSPVNQDSHVEEGK